MAKIKSIRARWILDSRGNPTVECDAVLDDGTFARAAVPSGASTGSKEAVELRDGDAAKFGGKGVLTAVANVNDQIAKLVVGRDAGDQAGLDQAMCDLDGTENKANLGANAILSVSLAVAQAAAKSANLPLYQYIAELTDTKNLSLPLPMMNVMNGGMHAGWATDIQEYMIMPVGAPTFADAVRYGAETFHALADILKQENYPTTVGDEGGYAPRVRGGNEEPLELIARAVEKAGYKLGEDIWFASDPASSEFYDNGIYKFGGENLTTEQMIEWWNKMTVKYPFVSVEDALSESDWKGWANLTYEMGGEIQLVGDDIFVTNTKLLQRAIDEKVGNAILIKPNQIGTLSETFAAVKLAKAHGYATVVSHRSGETDDTTIAHLAVGMNCEQIKTGSLSRGERVAKYNELLRIAEAEPDMPLARPFAK